MSCNRENVIWKSRDGTWSRGFFEFYQTGDGHEWDVQYIHDAFNWVSTGHPNQDEANKAWGGSNPGGCWLHEVPDADTDRYDQMAEKLTTALKEQAASNPRRVLR